MGGGYNALLYGRSLVNLRSDTLTVPKSVTLSFSGSDTLTIEIYYRAGSSIYEPSFRSNGERVSRFVSRYTNLTTPDADTVAGTLANPLDGGCPLTFFSSTASPDGGAALNSYLYRMRFHNSRRALLNAGLPPEFFAPANLVPVSVGVVSESEFAGRLRSSSVEEPLKTAALAVLSDTASAYRDKIRMLMTMGGGRCWSALSSDCLPPMRSFVGTTVFPPRERVVWTAPAPRFVTPSSADAAVLKPLIGDVAIADVVDMASATSPAGLPAAPQSAPAARHADPLTLAGGEAFSMRNRIALKTNMLGLGLLIANIGAEYGLTRHLSVHLPVYYSGVNFFTDRVKFRTFALQPELRWNFSAVEGLFVGVHATAAYFNLALGGDYRYQDSTGDTPLLGGGLSLGYRLRFPEAPRWGVEFVLGAGAGSLNYDRFVNEQNGPYVDSVSRKYFGVDNAAVSVFYEFVLGRGSRR